MDAIVITAILKPKENMESQLRAELDKVMEASRQEAGCLNYVLHQSIEDDTFVLHETYQDKAALETHVESDHYKEYRTNTADLIERREVFKLKAL